MSQFIEVTETNNQKILLNVDFIIGVRKNVPEAPSMGSGSIISLIDGQVFTEDGYDSLKGRITNFQNLTPMKVLKKEEEE